MKTLLFVILITTTGLFACKKSQQAMGADKIVPANSGTKTQAGKTYDMKISFISKGEGIDYKLKGKIDALIVSFNKENKTAITPVINSWGREGEKDYNFILKNLSTSKKEAFISSVKEIAGSTDMAHITFNK
jgi:hypothetical protein